MIRDKTGRVPNFVVDGNVLRHQPTGVEVEVRGRSDDEVRDAMRRLHRALGLYRSRNPETAQRNRSG